MLRINLPAFKKKKKFVVSDNYIYRIEILILNLNKKKFINILVHQNPSQKNVHIRVLYGRKVIQILPKKWS